MSCCGGDDDEGIFFRKSPGELLIAAAASRGHLRDARRRLIAIRCACGFKDAENEDGGGDSKKTDPFVLLVREFETSIELIRANATDSINDLQERTEIRKDMMAAEKTLGQMRTIVSECQHALGSAEARKKAPEKIERLKNAFETYELTLQRCEKLFEETKKMTSGFSWNAPSKLANSKSYSKAKQILAQRSGVGSVMQNRGENEKGNDGDDDGDATTGLSEKEMQEISLESAQETKQQMVIIKKQKQQVQSALDQIEASVATVREMASLLQRETEAQVSRIEDLDEHMQFQVDNIRSGNTRLKQLNATMQPFNMCVNCTIVVIILACCGFLLYKFDVLPI